MTIFASFHAPHPNPENSYGTTYGAHREFLEFDAEQHAQLKTWCEEVGITYSASVWDMTSAKEIAALNPKFIKIPSASNNHFEMLQWLCEHYEGEIQISFGMSTHEEEEQIVRLFEKNQRAKELEQFGLPKHIMERIEQLQREAFMDGYQYAISLLQESMQRKGR